MLLDEVLGAPFHGTISLLFPVLLPPSQGNMVAYSRKSITYSLSYI